MARTEPGGKPALFSPEQAHSEEGKAGEGLELSISVAKAEEKKKIQPPRTPRAPRRRTR
jgi:hypothetical protein